MELTYVPANLESGQRLLVVGASLYGVVLVTDSIQAAPQEEVPEDEAVVFTFTKEDAHRRR
jgi:hypothetical protein